MGLLNVSHTNMTQSLIDLQANLLKNPFYLFSDKKGTLVDYYNINTSRSTLDDSLKIAYDNKGEKSPLRYNMIHDFYLYGIDRVALNLENTDFGIEASEITGDAIILPDTITPYPGDCFVIKMIKNRFQFYVTSVTMDTFDNGGNYWKIEYLLDHQTDDELRTLNVVEEYEFISGNVGTQYSPVILKTKYNVCEKLDSLAMNLKRTFKSLYYNEKVQTYTFVYLYQVCKSGMNSDFFYDPYMIEFCINNKILADGGKYDYLDHKTTLKPDFFIKYERSIWKILEVCEKNELPSCKHSSAAQYIDDPGTIFGTRYEDYFEMTYNDPNPVMEKFAPALDIIDPQVIGHILNNQLFDFDSKKYGKYNILIKYFNHYNEIKVEDLIPLERLTEIDNNMANYFYLPMAIFVIEYYIKLLMKKNAEL